MLNDRDSIFFYGFICKWKVIKSNERGQDGIAFGYPPEILCPCCATWTWVEVKVPIRVGGVSRLAPADWQSGLGTGDIWFLSGGARGGWGQLVVKPSAVREQTDGGPNVTQRCTVIYVHSLRRHKQRDCTWSFVVTIVNLRLLFLLQYFWCNWYCALGL